MSTPPPPLATSISELILPYQPKLSQTLNSLKKSRLSIHNRLTSIIEDAAFTSIISTTNNLPLIANERCGSWYVPPAHKTGSVYFKSTDGHQGQWQFSLRRLNLNLLSILNEHGGAVIVDSTRRGKSMPDALSKTVPIWAAVLNRVLFPESADVYGLVTPEEVVGRSEHWQIEKRIEGFVCDFGKLGLDLSRLREVLGKPIKVEFVSRQTAVVKMECSAACHLLICCSASRQEHGDGDGYVQGAGDDTENWACGLTAGSFWRYKDVLLEEKNEEDLRDLIESLVREGKSSQSGSIAQIHLHGKPTPLFLGSLSELSTLDPELFDTIILCEKQTLNDKDPLPSAQNLPILELGCSPGKLGGKALRDKLPLVETFLRQILEKTSNPRVLILCSSGSDLSVGVALAILCRFVDDAGSLGSRSRDGLGKGFVRQQLACVVQSVPKANPSRATLQSVNTYLMGHAS